MELGIKLAQGRLIGPPIERLRREFRDVGFAELDVAWEHAATAAALPRRHGDPFDRLLVGQAMVEGLTLVTRDRNLQEYDVDILWT